MARKIKENLKAIVNAFMPGYWFKKDKLDVLDIVDRYAQEKEKIPDMDEIYHDLTKKIKFARLKNIVKIVASCYTPLVLGSLTAFLERKLELHSNGSLAPIAFFVGTYCQFKSLTMNALKVGKEIEEKYGEKVLEGFSNYMDIFSEKMDKTEKQARLRSLVYWMKAR